MSRRRSQDGFTLVEVVVVMSVLGIVVAAIAAAFTVVVRVSPTTEVRIDDARSTRGLATWLSHDTTSAPPYLNELDGGVPAPEGGVIVDQSLANPDNDDCNVGHANNTNVLHLQWLDDGFTSRVFIANYRYVVTGSDARLVRYACVRNGAAVTDLKIVNLTSGLATSPVATPLIDLATGEVYAVDLQMTAPGGDNVVIETGSRNPVEFYS